MQTPQTGIKRITYSMLRMMQKLKYNKYKIQIIQKHQRISAKMKYPWKLLRLALRG